MDSWLSLQAISVVLWLLVITAPGVEGASAQTLHVGNGAALRHLQNLLGEGAGGEGSELAFKIVNGNPVKSNLPWFVSITLINRFDKEGYYYYDQCGGTLIDSQHVLTAAHCFYDKKKKSFEKPRTVKDPTDGSKYPNYILQIGGLDFLNPVDMVDGLGLSRFPYSYRYGDKVICHPDYNDNTMENDVCVIKLNQPVPSNIKPVTLNFRKKPGKSTVPGTLSPARVKSNQAVGVQATAVGFGDTKNEGTSSDRLLQAKMPIIPVKSCMEEFDMPTPDSVLCVANKKADTCQGDSGGPLLKGDIQIGITSYGGDCLDGTGGVYTKVSYYQDWIASVVKRST